MRQVIIVAVLFSLLWIAKAAPVDDSTQDPKSMQGTKSLENGDDDLETAEALVFRPLFIYRKKQANRYRNVNRRSGNRWNGYRRHCSYY